MPTPRPFLSTKHLLARLHRAAVAGLITPAEASRALHLPTATAARRLADLARSGWLSRVRRGVYHIVPLEAATAESTTAEDPWTIASVLYDPCYIGGWSAAEHWGLTEQLFRSTFVVSAANIRHRSENHLGAEFHLAKVKRSQLEGLATAWRSTVRVKLSSAERTITDAATHPEWVGGGRQLSSLFVAYRDRRDANPSAMATELERHGNGAAAKRIGFLTEHLWPDAAELIERCARRKTLGHSKFDPSVALRGRLVTRWGLWLNTRISDATHT